MEVGGVLDDNSYMTLATVQPDGSPWSVPVKYAVCKGVLYWRSSSASVHSQNIAKDPRVSITIFDATPRAGHKECQAFYLQSTATQLSDSRAAEIVKVVGHRFSKRDESFPIYCAPMGSLDQEKSSDDRFYWIYDEREREKKL